MTTLETIKSINIDTIKEYLKKHGLTTKARNIKYYAKGEYIQIGDILIKFDLYSSIETLTDHVEMLQEWNKNRDKFNNAIKETQKEIEVIKKYNINNVPVLAIYHENNKPQIDFGGKIQSPCLFDREFAMYPELKDYYGYDNFNNHEIAG